MFKQNYTIIPCNIGDNMLKYIKLYLIGGIQNATVVKRCCF